jgi:hypothetical protein
MSVATPVRRVAHHMDEVVIEERVPGSAFPLAPFAFCLKLHGALASHFALGMSLRSRDLSSTRKKTVSLSISDAYRRSPHTVRLSRPFMAPLSPVDSSAPSSAVRSGGASQHRVGLARSSQPQHQRVLQEWRSWGLLFAAIVVVLLVMRSSSDMQTSEELAAPAAQASVAEELRRLQSRILDEALKQAEAGDAQVVSRFEKYGQSLLLDVANAKGEELGARLRAVELLQQQLAEKTAGALAGSQRETTALETALASTHASLTAALSELRAADASLATRVDATNERLVALDKLKADTTDSPAPVDEQLQALSSQVLATFSAIFSALPLQLTTVSRLAAECGPGAAACFGEAATSRDSSCEG